MTPEEEEKHSKFVQRYNDELSDREELQGWGWLGMFGLVYLSFILAALNGVGLASRSWSLLLAIPFALPKLAALHLRRRSMQRQAERGEHACGSEDQDLLKIGAVIVVADALLVFLIPLVVLGAGNW